MTGSCRRQSELNIQERGYFNLLYSTALKIGNVQAIVEQRMPISITNSITISSVVEQ